MRIGPDKNIIARLFALLALALTVAGILWGGRYFYIEATRDISRAYHGKFQNGEATLAPTDQQVLKNYALSQLTPIDHIFIDIKFRHMETLREKREEALKTGGLFRSEEDMVPAKIRHKGKTVKVSLRLKGDLPDHFSGDKWSLRAHTKDGEEVFGMRRFSIQSPYTRFYQQEPVFLDHMRREGVLAPRYKFVDVTVNGRDIGLMAVEEHFSKELFESQGRREGVIGKFMEEDLFHGFARGRDLKKIYKKEKIKDRHIPFFYNSWEAAKVDTFRAKKNERSPVLAEHNRLIKRMLRALQKKQVKPADILDANQVAKFMAICEFWNAEHPMRWNNLRFYLNPFTMKMEMVAFDANIVNEPERYPAPVIGKEWISRYIMQDEEIMRRYLYYIDKYSSDAYMDGLFEYLKGREKIYLKTLYKEYPGLPRIDFKKLRAKKDALKKINPADFALKEFTGRREGLVHEERPKYPAIAYAYHIKDKGLEYLEFVNPTSADVLLDEVYIHTKLRSVALSKISKEQFPIPLEYNNYDLGADINNPPQRSKIINLPGNIKDINSIEAKAHIKGQKTIYKLKVLPYVSPLERPVIEREATLTDLLARYPYLDWQERKGLTVKKGTWEIKTPFVIPERILMKKADGSADILRNAGLIIPEGAILSFGKNSYLQLAGRLISRGSKENPVILQGMGGRGWKGIAVIGSPSESRLENTIIRHTDITEKGPWVLTGGVTFYNSDVIIKDSDFEISRAEDALNIVGSKFELSNVTFKQTKSDAIDSDFSEGLMDNLKFYDIGGDAVDLSGSKVKLSSSEMKKIYDKAASVGEGSNFIADGLKVSDAKIGVAAKDSSSVSIKNSYFSKVEDAALMAYNKKPEYGSAILQAENISISSSTKTAIAQRGNKIIIDGHTVPTTALNVEDMYKEDSK